MTKVIGLMCVRDEADLLPQVYPHVRERVDELYVYEDGSQDGTWDIVRDADYAIRRVNDKTRLDIHRPNYHHLLEKIKEDNNFEKEDVWVVITMGDRFFLNKTPREIVEGANGSLSVEGVQLDFLRHRRDPWTRGNDTFPDYSDIRKLCRWVRVDERCIVAYKVTAEASYLKTPYPWPKQIGYPQYGESNMEGRLSIDMPFLEHQGRRSPRAAMWRESSGSRTLGNKYSHYDVSTFESTIHHMHREYDNYCLFPWFGLESLNTIVEAENTMGWKEYYDWYFKGVEDAWAGLDLPERTDI